MKRTRRLTVLEGLPRKDKFLRGYVDIYTQRRGGKRTYVGRSNLIVYCSREWILTSIFNLDNTNLGLPNGHNQWGVYWISLGDCNPDDPANPPAPQDTDTSLVNEHVIGSGSQYADSGKKKSFDAVQFLQDSSKDNRYLITQVTTTFEFDEVNSGANTPINEAALWISDSNDPSVASNFLMFARTTFPTINKDANLQLQVLWYIYS